MTIESGRQLLHYRLIAPIGEGGMGQVWQARDTTLDRDVAIKILPDAFARDADRLERFRREAKLLASLNHPNIAAVYGLHETEDVRFIALELVEGEDLAARLSRGPVPPDEAIAIATRIARGLEAAHDAGVIHRDLKPANVRVRPDGSVKVLDFGLAKAVGPDAAESATHLSQSPTVTSAGTVAGVILGTAAYMSPEQARGRPVDRRADVWAFGCLLYECLAGRKAFTGATISELLAEVLKEEPDWSALPQATPPSVLRVLRRCLKKDPAERMRDIGDVRLELTAADEAPDVVAAPAERPVRRTVLGTALAAAFLVGGLVGGVLVERLGPGPPSGSAPTAAIRATVELPESATIAFGVAPVGYDSPMLALSPDARWLVYVGRHESGSQLFRRDLHSFDDPEPIPGTQGALYPFFSPDGRSVGFVTPDKVKRISLEGDALQSLADANVTTLAFWPRDDLVYFTRLEGKSLFRVPASGGDSEPAPGADRWDPTDIDPDGRTALINTGTRGISGDYLDIGVADLGTGEVRTLIQNGYDGRFLGTGHILFARAGDLLAVRFDRKRLDVDGEPVTVVRDVAMDSLFSQVQVAVSRSGAVAFVPGGDQSVGRIAWIDADGTRGVLPVEPRIYGRFDLDPSDRRLAVHVADVKDYVWIYDVERNEGRPLHGDTSQGWPVWNESGTRIAYSARNGDAYAVEIRDLEGRTQPQRLVDLSRHLHAGAWSKDGSHVLYFGGGKIAGVPLGGAEPTAEFAGWFADFSPDGKWVVHSSEEGGNLEILVRSWPGGEVVRRIGSGIEPVWCATGDVFYREASRWYRIPVTLEPTLSYEPAVPAFEVDDFLDTPGISYDVTSDGRRLYYVSQLVPDVPDRIRIIPDLAPHLP